MADVNINKFRASVVRDGSKPASPGFIVSEGQDPVDPAGTGQNHLPVTIAAAATGLSITESQVLGGAGTTLQYLRGDGSLATFPDLTGYVPYTGANQTVNLNTQQLQAGHTTLTTNGSTETLTINHTSGSGKAINVTKGGNGEGLYVNKTSGSGNAATIVGTLEATTLVKTGGTSSQFLKADGSVDSTSYGTGTVTSVGLSSATSGVTIGSTPVTTSGTITLNIATASGLQNGLLSSSDWSTFNGKQNALTNPVTGTGASGQVAYFTGTTAISSESNLFWDATNDRLGINVSPSFSLDVNGVGRFSDGTQGLIVRAYTGADGWGAIYPVGVTPNTTNYTLIAKSTNAVLNASTSVTLAVGDSGKLTANSIGVQVNGRATIIGLALPMSVASTDASELYCEYKYNTSTVVGYIGNGTGLMTGGGNDNFGIRAQNSLVFSTLANERMRITSGGNVLIGTTTDNGNKLQVSGTASFSDNVNAQGFNTSVGTVSAPNSTWVTVYTIPSTQAAEGVYYVYGHYNDDAGGMAFIQVLADRSSQRAINGSNSSVQLQISGRNIQVLQVYGVTLSIQYSVLWQKLR